MIAFVFPGQGSQYVGMGKDLSETAKDLFEIASDVLGFDLAKLCFDGPDSDLNKTENTQPAILTVSYALLREVLASGISPVFVAGHSLGEYTAAVCGGVFSFEDAVKITRKRGELMQKAQPEGKGAMAAVLGLDAITLKQICESITDFYVDLANLNCPGQIVISGEAEAVKKASELAKQKGAKKVVPLQVSIPSHCMLMREVAQEFEKYLQNFNFKNSKFPIVSNVDAEAVQDAEAILNALIKQLYSPVRWQDCVKYMISKAVDTFIEIGPGKVLSGLIKRIDPSVKVYNIENLNDLTSIKKEELK
ncbi:ACP S-malonyltransferase [Thermodesulfovibrio sp. 3907-1M]|uniref:Malonyl CoA-acyl carrier protein transacylase n=1 Tax=Thermodesulfovibrio autotrophicus TaxID=3118333 RepID=A0AAU8GX11_9BACT